MAVRELAPNVEAKTSKAQKPSEHDNPQERVARKTFAAERSLSQPGSSPLPRIQPAGLNRGESGKSSRSSHYFFQLQQRHGNRYVQRIVKSGQADDAGSPSENSETELEPQPFSNGAVTYLHEGMRGPESSSARHSSAPKISRAAASEQPHLSMQQQAGHPAGGAANGKVPDIQPAWYNFSIPFTDYEFDPSLEGIKTAGNLAVDKAKEGAGWVKDRVVEGVEWIFDKISGLVNAGIDWLKSKFNEIKEFATGAFDTIKNTLANVLTGITSPMAAIKGAFTNMDAGLLSSAWNALSAGANAAWQAVKSVVDGVLKIGSGIWNTVSGYVTSLFDSVESLLDSTPFSLLPEFLQNGARKLYNTIRSLWESIRDFWTDFWQRITSFIRDLLASIEAFVQQITSYVIDGVIATVKTLKEVYDFVQLLVTDPEAVIRPIVDHLAGKIQAEAPPKAREVAQQKMSEALASKQAPASRSGVVQRSPDGSTKRSTASRDEVNEAVMQALSDQWAALDIGAMLWDTFVKLFWPPATIRAIGHEFYELWNTDWANAVDSLFAPRSIFDDFGGFFHDIWSNILILLDFPLALWRRLNSILMLLMGYVTILLVIVGAVGGAIVGNVPGALAGAVAGLGLAWAIGEALFLSFLLAEGTSALKAFLDLYTARQTQEEKNRDYVQIAASTIGIGVALVIALLFALLGRIASEIVGIIKARGKVAPPKQLPPGPPPPKQLGPGPEPPKQLGPGPEPPKQLGPGPEPPKQLGPGPETPKTEPPKTEPPKTEPPKTEPPKTEPPKIEPPKEEPPKTEPPKEEPPKPGRDLKDLSIEELVKEGDKKVRPKETKEQAAERVKEAKAEAQRRGYCFVKGTLIQTPEGPAAIESLVAGQMVLAKGEAESVQSYAIVESMRGSTSTLYHLEIAGTVKLSTTRDHPFFVTGRGWRKAKDVLVGDALLSLDNATAIVTKVVREDLSEPVPTFNLHVEEAHTYFAGNEPAVWVHNGTPVADPVLTKPLLWGLGAGGPRQRLPSPAKDPTSADPKLREPFPGDTDGASAWRTSSTDDVGRFLGARNTEGGTGNHGAITEAQLKAEGLIAVNTEGTGAAADAGFQHVSIRPEGRPDPSVELTEAEMAEVKAKLDRLKPVAQNKPSDFLC